LKLHSPQFERSLRNKIRREAKDSKTLKRELKAGGRLGGRSPWKAFGRLTLSAGFAFLVWKTLQSGGTTAALALVTLWGLAFFGIVTSRILSNLYGSADAAAFSVLPVGSETIFRWELLRSLRASLWLLLDFFCCYGVCALYIDSAFIWALVVPAAVLNWLMVFALALLAVACQPNRPYILLPLFILGGGFLLLVLGDHINFEIILNILKSVAPALNLVVPTGWVPSLFEGSIQKQLLTCFLLTFLVATTLWSIQPTRKRLLQQYIFPELNPLPGENNGAEAAGYDPDDLVMELDLDRHNVNLAEIEKVIASREFLFSPPMNQSVLERILWKWLNPRERVLFEYLFPDELNLMARWTKVFRNTAIAVALIGITALLSGRGIALWIGVAGLFITLCQSIVLMNWYGRAFEKHAFSGVIIPAYAAHGIGLHEVNRVLTKLAALQIPFFAIYSFIGTAGFFLFVKHPGVELLPTAIKVTGLLLATRCFFLFFAISGGTNDTSRFRVASLVLMGMVVAVTLAFIGIGSVALLATGAPAWISWGIAVNLPWIFLRFYIWCHNRTAFDLMSVPQEF
jgi:hypothetical protein